MFAEVDFLIIDTVLNSSGKLQIQSGCQDNDVGVQLFSRLECNTGAVEPLDMIGDHLCMPLFNRLEHIAVWHCAQALIPWVVRRREMRLDIIIRPKGLTHLSQHKPA